jgi:hypothetical protein
MKGKAGLVIGLAAGYVLGTRAGRERYEQIKTQALKVWELDPVQAQVEKVKAFGLSAAKAVPAAVWDGAKRVTGAATGSGTTQQKAQRARSAASSAAKDVAEAVDESVDAAQKAGAKKSSSSSSGSTGSKTARSTRSRS